MATSKRNQDFVSNNQRRNFRITKFVDQWITNKDYYCWDDKEIFQEMEQFLVGYDNNLLRKLKNVISFKPNQIIIPQMKYSEILSVFSLKPKEIAQHLEHISYTFLKSINLFSYFKLQQDNPSVKQWSAHYNNVFFYFKF